MIGLSGKGNFISDYQISVSTILLAIERADESNQYQYKVVTSIPRQQDAPIPRKSGTEYSIVLFFFSSDQE